jgi:hypothetical protein
MVKTRKQQIRNALDEAAIKLSMNCEIQKIFANKMKKFVITQDKLSFNDALKTIKDNNILSETHMIDLSKYEYDKVFITFTKREVWKEVNRVGKLNSIKAILLTDTYTITNGVDFDSSVLDVYKKIDGPEKFFRFYEQRNEYKIVISLVKNGKVIEEILTNNSSITAIYTNKPYEFRDREGNEVKSDRLSLTSPMISFENYNYVCRFNDQNEENKLLIDMYSY